MIGILYGANIQDFYRCNLIPYTYNIRSMPFALFCVVGAEQWRHENRGKVLVAGEAGVPAKKFSVYAVAGPGDGLEYMTTALVGKDQGCCYVVRISVRLYRGYMKPKVAV